MHLRRRFNTLRQSGISRRARRSLRWGLAPLLALGSLLVLGVAHPTAKHEEKGKHEEQEEHEERGKPDEPKIEFDMVRSAGLPSACVPLARGEVKVVSKGPVEEMHVEVDGLPPNTDFDFFVIQKPGGPFGLSWYQGDIETNDEGRGHETFIGRFNIETFIVAPGAVPAPTPHGVLDADLNPITKPIHTYHLGLWFNSPVDGANAGCPGGPTPFNGDHTAGIQILNTHNFPDLTGPLMQLQ
jgi:hypothetical protein